MTVPRLHLHVLQPLSSLIQPSGSQSLGHCKVGHMSVQGQGVVKQTGQLGDGFGLFTGGATEKEQKYG